MNQVPPEAPASHVRRTSLRILHVTPYFEEAWSYGGIPRLAGTLCRELARRGHEVTVCTTDVCTARGRLPSPPGQAPGKPWTFLTREGTRVHVFPNVSNRAAYHLQFFTPRGLSGFLRRCASHFDVAHLHALHNLPVTIAARHLARARVPYLLAPNGTAPPGIERRRLLKSAFDATLGRNVVRAACRLLAVSEAERRQFGALGIDDGRIRVVPNPIDLSEFAPLPRRGAFRPRVAAGADRLVLFLGKLTPRKRVDVLVRAFAALGRPGTRLIVAGNDMGEGARLQRLVSTLGLNDRVTFTGLLTGRERLDALADADVAVYASKDEIFGLVPVESLMCGTPVIVADDSGCGEVVSRLGGGLTVREGDVEALRLAIDRVLSSPDEWRTEAAAARERVPEFCAAGAVVEQLEIVYAEMIEPGRTTLRHPN